MTPRFARTEDALRELRASVAPVDAPEIVAARRRRTVSNLQGLQARTLARRDIVGSWRRHALVAALVLFPTGAVAATWVALREKPPSSPHGDLGVRSLAVATVSGTSPRGVMRTDPETVAGPEAVAVPSPVAPERPEEAPLAAPAPAEYALSPNATTATMADRALQSGAPVAPRRTPTSVARASFGSFPTEGVGEGSDPSTLAAENAMMERAMTAARGGDDARAVTLFGDLLGRYPRSPLAQNAEVERFRALQRLGDTRAASRLARRYLGAHPDGMARDEARRLGVEAAAETAVEASAPVNDVPRR